jgi:hypothetical protein
MKKVEINTEEIILKVPSHLIKKGLVDHVCKKLPMRLELTKPMLHYYFRSKTIVV